MLKWKFNFFSTAKTTKSLHHHDVTGHSSQRKESSQSFSWDSNHGWCMHQYRIGSISRCCDTDIARIVLLAENISFRRFVDSYGLLNWINREMVRAGARRRGKWKGERKREREMNQKCSSQQPRLYDGSACSTRGNIFMQWCIASDSIFLNLSNMPSKQLLKLHLNTQKPNTKIFLYWMITIN